MRRVRIQVPSKESATSGEFPPNSPLVPILCSSDTGVSGSSQKLGDSLSRFHLATDNMGQSNDSWGLCKSFPRPREAARLSRSQDAHKRFWEACRKSNALTAPDGFSVLAWAMPVWWDVEEACSRGAWFESGVALSSRAPLPVSTCKGPPHPVAAMWPHTPQHRICINTRAMRTAHGRVSKVAPLPPRTKPTAAPPTCHSPRVRKRWLGAAPSGCPGPRAQKL